MVWVHRISDVDIKGKTGVCAECGPVRLRHKGKRWLCANSQGRWTNSSRRFGLKTQALEYKGSKCFLCGYDKCPRALHFHHRNPKEKSFTFPAYRDWPAYKRELDKCVLVCANCHAEIHAELVTLPET